MSVNIKNPRVESLLDEVVRLTGESKTEAVGRALEERRQRLVLRRPGARGRLRYLLERDVWSAVPAEILGTAPLTREEEERVLGLGPGGV